MAQSDFGTINPATKTGSVLATDLNGFRNALHSLHKGSSRPTYDTVPAGLLWIDDTAPTLWVVNMYDGTTDIPVGTINTSTGKFIPGADAATIFADIKQAASTTVTGVVELATDAETSAGTPTGRAVTVGNLLSMKASQTEVDAGTNSTDYVTPSTLLARPNFKKGVDVASAAALTVGSDGNYFDVTGTTAVTSIATVGVGTAIKLHFDDALTLTHDATNLILPRSVNIKTTAGDEAEFVEYASGDWRCTNYPPTWEVEENFTYSWTGGIVEYINDNALYIPLNPFDVDGDLTISTWESIGPSGSGADNIFTELGQLPPSARAVKVRIYGNQYDATAGVYEVSVYAGATGTTNALSTTRLYRHFLYSPINTSVGMYQDGYIILDSNNVFSMYWYGSATTTNISMQIVGYIL